MSCKCCGGGKPEIAIMLPSEITCEATIKRLMAAVHAEFPQFHFLTGRAMDGYKIKRVEIVPLPDQVDDPRQPPSSDVAEIPSYTELPRIERMARDLFERPFALAN